MNNLQTITDIIKDMVAEREPCMCESADDSIKLSKETVAKLEHTLDVVQKKLESSSSFKQAIAKLEKVCAESLKTASEPFVSDAKFESDITNKYGYREKTLTWYHYPNNDRESPHSIMSDFNIHIECCINRPLEDYTTLVTIGATSRRDDTYYVSSAQQKIANLKARVMDIIDKVLEQELKKANLIYDKFDSNRLFVYEKYYISEAK